MPNSPLNFMSLYPLAMARLGQHASLGAKKYPKAHPLDTIPEKYQSPEYALPKLTRHLGDFLAGEVTDPETNNHQMCGIINAAMMILEGYENAKGSTTRSIYEEEEE